jgi:hypothetical protein
MCPSGSNGLDLFGSSGFDSLSSQPKPHYNLPGAHDLLTSVLLQIDDSRLFGYLGFGCFNISPFPPSGSHDPPTRILLAINGQDPTSGVSPPPRPQTSRAVDLAPPVFLDDGWSLLTWDFGTLTSQSSYAHKG